MAACTISDCEKPAEKRAMCGMHYRRWQRYGDPQTVKQPKRLPLPERYERFVVRCDGCWDWKQNFSPDGYTRLFWEGRWHTGHRISWVLHRGAVPAGAHVLHACDNRRCTNPDHLFIGDNVLNVADKVAKGRHRWANPELCTKEGCIEPARTKQMCKRHYNAAYHATRRLG